jgi:hypothetical protein
MSGATHPLPQFAFMAWCSVKKKAQGPLYLYFNFIFKKMLVNFGPDYVS